MFTIRKFSRDQITFFLCPLFEFTAVLKAFSKGSLCPVFHHASYSIENKIRYHSNHFRSVCKAKIKIEWSIASVVLSSGTFRFTRTCLTLELSFSNFQYVRCLSQSIKFLIEQYLLGFKSVSCGSHKIWIPQNFSKSPLQLLNDGYVTSKADSTTLYFFEQPVLWLEQQVILE